MFSPQYRKPSATALIGKVRCLLISSSVSKNVNPVATCCNRLTFPQKPNFPQATAQDGKEQMDAGGRLKCNGNET